MKMNNIDDLLSRNLAMPPQKKAAYRQSKVDFTLEESFELDKLKRNDLYSFIMLDIYPYWQDAIDGEWRLGKLHEEWSKIERNHKRSIILAPRDHLKSFCWTIALPLQKAKYNLKKEIFIIKEESRVARKTLSRIKNLLKLPTLRHLKPAMPETWTNDVIKLSNGTTITVMGFFQGKLGEHPDLILFDDMISKKVVNMDKLNAKYIEYFYSEIMGMELKQTETRINGTTQRKDDLYHTLNKDEYYFKSYDAIVNEEKKQTLFPEYWTWKRLMMKKKQLSSHPKYGEQFWLKEYRNKTVDYKGEMFKNDFLQTELFAVFRVRT